MKVKELVRELLKMDQEMEAWVSASYDDLDYNNPVSSVQVTACTDTGHWLPLEDFEDEDIQRIEDEEYKDPVVMINGFGLI